jgi:tRNA G18 (ribose-2'-O)-methylase SpoU
VRAVDVSDPADPRVAPYLHLTDAAHARQDATFVAEGLLVLDTLLATVGAPRSVLCTPNRLTDVAERLGDADVPVLVAAQAIVDEITGFHLHRGVVAVADRPPPLTVAEVLRSALSLLVLESVNDIENLGSLFRNAAALGAGGIVLCPQTADPLYRRSVRVSVGHVLRVPYARATAWPGALAEIRAAGFELVALTPRGDERLDDVAPPAKPALLVGAEGPGLSGEALEACDRHVCIPMAAGVDSLNVATAAAIGMQRLLSSPA